ncbi:MAG: hypothetical protein PVJ92_02525 [Candidatus Dependentiae bacterium]|jgi:ABC-type uncharacterized transport system substrate-binding protein
MKAFPGASRFSLHTLYPTDSLHTHVHTLHKAVDSVHRPIAIILSNMHNAREVTTAIELTQQVISCFGYHRAPTVRCLSAQNSAALMRGEIGEALASGEYGAVVTISDWAAHAVASEYERSQLRMPFFFTNMHDSSTLSALDMTHPAYSYTAGITVKHPAYSRMLSLLKDMSCTADRALVVVGRWQNSGATGSFASRAMTPENVEMCKARGIDVQPLYAYDHQDLEAKLRSRLREGKDLIIAGDDSLALANAELLGHFAQLYHTPVITQSLEMVKHGHAAIGCGVWGNYTNTILTKNLLDVLEHGMQPSDIALSSVIANDRVRFKKAVLAKQGLRVPPQMMRALEARDIDDDDDTPKPLLYVDKEYAEL